jgi:hypothetical protein
MGRSTSTTSQLVTPNQRGDARETENVAGCKSLLINLPKRSAVVSASQIFSSQIFSSQIFSGQIFSGEHGIVYSTTMPLLVNKTHRHSHGGSRAAKLDEASFLAWTSPDGSMLTAAVITVLLSRLRLVVRRVPAMGEALARQPALRPRSRQAFN